MDWANAFSAATKPTEQQIEAYVASPLWAEINHFLQQGYDTEPKYSYSACSMQPGWNIKYQKAGKSLCTLYPMEGFFYALVVIGQKEQPETELLAPSLTAHVQELLQTAGGLAGVRWLMIAVTDEQILADVKTLIQVRRKMKK